MKKLERSDEETGASDEETGDRDEETGAELSECYEWLHVYEWICMNVQ